MSPWPSGEGGRGLSLRVGGRLQSRLRENRVNCLDAETSVRGTCLHYQPVRARVCVGGWRSGLLD